MTGTAVMLDRPRTIGLTDDETATLARLLSTWRSKAWKNQLLAAYHDGEVVLKDFGISIPPQLKGVKFALGWPRKAVRALARKHQFEGFSLGGSTDPFDVDETLQRNAFDLTLGMGIESAYELSFSLLTTSLDPNASDQRVDVHARDALWSSGIYDHRAREVSAAFTITEADDDGMPSSAVLWMQHSTVLLERRFGVWKTERLRNDTGRALVEILPHEPGLKRPFGRSRITPEVRYLTDAAIRTMARTETGAEFFASPQRYALGANEKAFDGKGRWSAIMGRVWNLSSNEDGQIPEVGQFAQMSMQPHLEMYRQLAQNFCAETNLPQSAVGIFADNPASAEAMQAAEAQLSEDAEYQWRVFRPALIRMQQNVIMLREKAKEPPPESWATVVNWTPARYVSPTSAADWAVKAVGAVPELASTNVVLRRLGLSQGEIEEVRSEWGRGRAGSVLEKLAAVKAAAPTEDQTAGAASAARNPPR